MYLKNVYKIAALLLILFMSSQLHAQFLLSGTIRDEKNIAIPFAKIYVKNDAAQLTQANANGHYEMRLMPGEYYLVYAATGYEDREAYVAITDKEIIKDFQLFPIKTLTVSDMEVNAKKTNPGREIMLKVVQKRDQINPWNYAHTANVYIRAYEKLGVDDEKKQKIEKKEQKEKVKKEKEKAKQKEKEKKKGTGTEVKDERDVNDPFEAERKKTMELANSANLVEIQIQRNYSPPTLVKEVRNAYTKKGSDRGLYYLTTVKSNFNFFENLLHLDDLHQSPVSSPISNPGILSYKYRLEAQYEENGRKIHKIKIIPRSTSTSTLTGYIYVIDSLWLVQKLELKMEKGNLLKYDNFTIYQEFEHPGDSMCVLSKQTLTYGTNYSGNVSNCKTVAVFSDYNFKPDFPAKFFSNELAVTAQEAYEKDSTFWTANRVVSLTDEEKRFIIIKDSIHELTNRKEYLDSIDSAFNKITFLKVFWDGVDYRIREKKMQWSFNPLISMYRFFGITGPTVTPGFGFFKKWKDERFIDTYNEYSYCPSNDKSYFMTDLTYRYNPFRYGTLYASASHSFDLIRSNDAFSQILNPNNFIVVTNVSFGHYNELINGLFLYARVNLSERKSLTGSKFLGIFEQGELGDSSNYFTDFPTYQAVVLRTQLSYTPKQKFMREPYRKVILGSKWPTFSLTYEKGIQGILGSDVNHDYLQAGISQSFKIGTIGTSNYNVTSGLFLNSKRLYEADFRYHRRSDPIWFSNPLGSFQQLNVSLPSKKIYFEGHIVHHDNGAIINKIPFMKKTNIGLVFGGGLLYVTEFDWLHSELFVGLERTFKFARRRLRIGVYGIASDGNNINPISTYKVSFAFLNDRNMKFNF